MEKSAGKFKRMIMTSHFAITYIQYTTQPTVYRLTGAKRGFYVWDPTRAVTIYYCYILILKYKESIGKV